MADPIATLLSEVRPPRLRLLHPLETFMPFPSPETFDGIRAMLRKLPRSAETLQWGSKLVYWTMDKAVGGKMFAVIEADAGPDSHHVLAFAAGPERMPLLLELDGVMPAPYLARAHWVAIADWKVFSLRDLHAELHAAYEYVGNRMPPRVQRLYDLSSRDYRALVRERRELAKRR